MIDSPRPYEMFSLSILELLATALQHLQINNYVNVSTLAILIFEYIITFELEVKFIWKSPWTFGKVLYLAVRYIPFIDGSINILRRFIPYSSPQLCHNLFNAITWLILIGMSTAEVIFTLRTWAVWGRKKWLAYFLSVYYITSWTGTFIAAGISVNTLEFGAQQYIARGCLVTGGNPSLLWVDWTLLFLYDFVLMVLMLIPAFKAFKQNGKSDMTKIVLRDVVSSANLVVIRALSSDYFDVILELGRVIHSVLACRVVLHTRELGSVRN
ncbi:hypothetical protein BDQ17DRAFT_1410107 [Cyathus striatus]|nr:hypothetical protein BDQ17DRAFT_1410107 [Cyathus striatus]